ncbi:hypothetical protein G6L96_008895 [Agrobacterium tumefaciens]|uniref:hypothetical protein n=1 Tax=Agrobacterium tumefaciens TaxID=358 RepID=UPI0015737CED|nr:hypothetical protein [Agrobacterium tumefaciens]WCK69907.1 hypothetical protein G6L96_008895 [Agrobacterium tumefaciens]
MDQPSFQTNVFDWILACFGSEIASDKTERADRFTEEALELLQSVDYPIERIIALIGYVYGRAKGESKQETGGVMVTLASFCAIHDIDMAEAGETELARVWTKIDAIRAKQASKPTGSALPTTVSDSVSLQLFKYPLFAKIRKRSFGQGLAVAAGIAMSSGHEIAAIDILGAAGYRTAADMRADEVDDYDINLCAPVLKGEPA